MQISKVYQRIAVILVLAMGGCEAAKSRPNAPSATGELALRRQLGIPDDAAKVMIFSQSSHLDINWQLTFEEYSLKFVDRIISQAILLLENEPRATYSIAEMGFLRGWWDRHPADRARLTALVAAHRFRIVGGGITTPDTNLPPTESLIRDYTEGLTWAYESFGGHAEYAWLPDTFGHNPLTPEVLWGLGFADFGFSRIDGAVAIPVKLPTALESRIGEGSIAANTHAGDLLALGHQSFVWKGAGDAQTLAMFMPYSYCLGDFVDIVGPATPVGVNTGYLTDASHVTAKMLINWEKMAPFSRTGYVFIPVGCDFQPPKDLLTRYADDWNRMYYAKTGAWAVRATFEEYSRLTEFHRSELPAMPVDGNPVFTGYYGQRPRIKQLSFETTAALLGEELLAALTGAKLPENLSPWWWIQSLSNHHDWITGTSLDRIYFEDQLAVHEKLFAEVAADLKGRLEKKILALANSRAPAAVALNPGGVDQSVWMESDIPSNAPGVLARDGAGNLLPTVNRSVMGGWRVGAFAQVPAGGYAVVRYEDSAAPVAKPAVTAVRMFAAGGATTTVAADARWVTLSRADLTVTLSADAGWSLTSITRGNKEFLQGRGDELVVYQDDGGLYRIGSERPGCGYAAIDVGLPASFALAATSANGLRATVRLVGDLSGYPVTREVELDPTGPIRFRAILRAPERTTVVSRFDTGMLGGEFRNGTGYGTVARAYAHRFSPSYWPATWAGLFGAADFAILARGETSGFLGEGDGGMEVMLKRDAPLEKCSVLGADGHDDDYDTVSYALYTGQAGDENQAMAQAHGETVRTFSAFRATAGGGSLPLGASLASIDTPGVVITAVRPHALGGYLFRVVRLVDDVDSVTVNFQQPITGVTEVDLRDRALKPFRRVSSAFDVKMRNRIVSFWAK